MEFVAVIVPCEKEIEEKTPRKSNDLQGERIVL